MKHFFMLSIMFVALLPLFGASTEDFSVSGRVLDNKSGESLAFANVAFYENDSVYQAGATTDAAGKFIIDGLRSGKYKVKISYIGYRDVELDRVVGKTVDFGDIRLTPEAVQLDESVVVAKLPTIEHKIDKTVVNVANAVSAEGSTALDMLRKAPGVAVDKDGNVQLDGKSVNIWIDGRPAQLSGKDLEAYLSGMDGASLDKIELMPHPSSKYDAAGNGGIINLKTKKNRLSGFNGSARVSYGGENMHSKYDQNANGSLNLNYRSPVSNTFFTYSPRYSEDMFCMESQTRTSDNADWQQNSYSLQESTSSAHSLKLGTDFFIGKENTLGFIVNAQLRNGKSLTDPVNSYNETFLRDTLQGCSNTSNYGKDGADNVSANLNFTHVFDENKSSELTLNADYMHWASKDSSYQESHYYAADKISVTQFPNIFSQKLNRSIDIYSFKADFQHTFLEKLQFESGLKASVSRTKNDLLRKNKEMDVWLVDTTQSGKFYYTEQIYALYGSLAAQLGKKWSLKGGLRGEYTYSIGDWVSENATTRRGYFDLFPTVFASYTLSERYNFSTSYTIRINRPSYWQLKPFREYIDENTAVEGNPDLLPQKSHEVSLSVNFIQCLQLSAFYQHSVQSVSQVLELEGKDKVYRWKNFGTDNLLGLSFSCSEIPIVKNWLVFNSSLFGGYTESRDLSGYRNGSFVSNIYGNLTLLLPKDWKMEVEGWGFSGGSMGYFKASGCGELSVGVKKGFLNNTLSVALYGKNLLNTNNQKIDYSAGGISYKMKQHYTDPSFRLSVSYRFGKVQQTKRRNVGELEEVSRAGSGGGNIGKE